MGDYGDGASVLGCVERHRDLFGVKMRSMQASLALIT